jgi:hypothetical protein
LQLHPALRGDLDLDDHFARGSARFRISERFFNFCQGKVRPTIGLITPLSASSAIFASCSPSARMNQYLKWAPASFAARVM